MDSIEEDVKTWLNQVVIGLNLCPFSVKPARENRVRFHVTHAQVEEDLLAELSNEMKLLDAKPTTEIETTLLIIPNFLHDFFDYTQFLGWAQAQLKRQGWLGVYQLASFHPNYYFAGTEPDDDENLTNRSPYPIIHIIREASLERALEYVEGVEDIPDRNRARVESLSSEQKKNLFPYLFNSRSDDDLKVRN
ncbi:MAG: DUF1415 domain-containing protein [Gammaproteobacteria bacterium]|nr:MAG: DUF1415 domain-containing protein [Gammaproteobacteria bacterium]